MHVICPISNGQHWSGIVRHRYPWQNLSLQFC